MGGGESIPSCHKQGLGLHHKILGVGVVDERLGTMERGPKRCYKEMPSNSLV